MTIALCAVLKTDGTRLFEPLNLSFGAGCTGLVGRNGCGKSSLLRLIGGQAVPHEGSVTSSGTIWSLPQMPSVARGETVASLLGVDAQLAALQRILEGEGTEDDLSTADWTLNERLDTALDQVGLSGLSPQTPADLLSGGERTRVYLAALRLAEPDIVLLDEPTNHLDEDGRQQVLKLIDTWSGCLLVATHDRTLLERVDGIVELSSFGGKVYGGNYAHYRQQRDLEHSAALSAAQSARQSMEALNREAQASKERLSQRVSTGRREGRSGSLPPLIAGLRKSWAQSAAGRETAVMTRRLEAGETRLAEAEQALERVRSLEIPLVSTGLSCGTQVLALKEVSVDRGQGQVFTPLDMHIRGPERIALTGANGSGKSTLLDVIAGRLEPSCGTLECSLPPVLLDQHVSLLRDEETLREAWLRLNPEGTTEDAQAALARFLFRNTAALKRVGELSGGEKVRAGLACTVAGKVPARFLLLDEPTNHLDLDAVHAVEQVLSAYDGALVVVSHDRHFLEAIGIEREIRL